MKSITLLVQIIILVTNLYGYCHFVMAAPAPNEPPQSGHVHGASTTTTATTPSDGDQATALKNAEEVIFYEGQEQTPIPAPFGTCVPLKNDQGQFLSGATFKKLAYCYFFVNRDCSPHPTDVPVFVVLPPGAYIRNPLAFAKVGTGAYLCTDLPDVPAISHLTDPKNFALDPKHLGMVLKPPTPTQPPPPGAPGAPGEPGEPGEPPAEPT